MTLGTVPDCRLLALYFASPAGGRRRVDSGAASGRVRLRHLQLVQLLAPRLRQPHERARGVPGARSPSSARYHPVTNPNGIRCTSFEQIATQLGRNPANGFAWRPLDNIGVQYGLTALQSGAITPEQFVSLNENVGGFDVIGQVIPQRVDGRPDRRRPCVRDRPGEHRWARPRLDADHRLP